MWDTPEAKQKLVDIIALLDDTIARCKQTKGKKSEASSRVLVTGVGVEILTGICEAFEIDQDIRTHTKRVSDGWLAGVNTRDEVNQMFVTVVTLLERTRALLSDRSRS